MSEHWLRQCAGCGCSYLRVSDGAYFCQYCSRDIAESPATFKTLDQRNVEKAVLTGPMKKSGTRKKR